MCWQLAHAQKAEAVDLTAAADTKKDGDKTADQGATGTPKPGAQPTTAASTNAPSAQPPASPAAKPPASQ